MTWDFDSFPNIHHHTTILIYIKSPHSHLLLYSRILVQGDRSDTTLLPAIRYTSACSLHPPSTPPLPVNFDCFSIESFLFALSFENGDMHDYDTLTFLPPTQSFSIFFWNRCSRYSGSKIGTCPRPCPSGSLQQPFRLSRLSAVRYWDVSFRF